MRKRNTIEDPALLAETIIEGMHELKASDVVSLSLKKLKDPVTDYFIICHGESKTQVLAIADKIMEKTAAELQIKSWRTEGFENAQWIILDYIDVVVHIFQRESRFFYDLESLWADSEIRHHKDVPENKTVLK
jgi:ribosome-associated protein